MIRVGLRALLTRPRRLLAPVLSVAIGVAMISGVLLERDGTRAAATRLFTELDAGAQVIVSAPQPPGTGAASGALAGESPAPPALAPTLVSRIRHTAGVAAASGQLSAPATLIGADGAPLPDRPPTEALSLPAAPFAAPALVHGRDPRGRGELALDTVTAAAQHWRVGSLITLLTPVGATRLRISGLIAGASTERLVLLTPALAHHLYGTRDLSRVQVAVAPGAARVAVEAALRARLGPGPRIAGVASEVAGAVARISGAFASLDAGLLGFAVVVVLIGALVILNTFAATAAARRRQLALTRTLGATRTQIRLLAGTEALAIGVLGAVLGVLLAFPVAAVLAVLVGGASPALGVVPLLIGAALGTGVSLLAGIVPALAAGQAAPVEALRAASLPGGRPRLGTALRLLLSAGLAGGGLALILSAGGDLTQRLWLSAAGGALLIGAALILGPLVLLLLLAVEAVLSTPRRDPVGALARAAARQGRSRVALGAAALTISLALALVIAAYAAGLRGASSRAIRQDVVADLAVGAADGSSPIPAASIRAVAAVPDLAAVSALKTVSAAIPGAGTVTVNGVDPTTWPSVYRFAWRAGSAAVLAGLRGDRAIIERDTARRLGARVGSHLRLLGPAGQRLDVVVTGIYSDPGLLGGITLGQSALASAFGQPELQNVLMRLTGSVPAGVARRALTATLARFPGVVVRDQTALADRLSATVGGIVALLDALLVLAVVMSLLGIGASLNLAIQARSSEIGTLRALGMTSGQARRLIHHQSRITAAVGALSGIALGLLLGLCLCAALSAEGFSFHLPWLTGLGALAAAGLAGVGAAVWPARRVARLGMLAAIAEE